MPHRSPPQPKSRLEPATADNAVRHGNCMIDKDYKRRVVHRRSRDTGVVRCSFT